MQCLYANDYGSSDPGFNSAVGGGALLRGFEAHRAVLARAQNLGQLEAMKRQLSHGEQIQWCDQGYGWTNQPPVEAFFVAALILVVAPWFVGRVARPVMRRARRRIHDRTAVARAMP